MDTDVKRDALTVQSGGAVFFNHEDEEPGRFGFATQDTFGVCAAVSMAPAEAHALAALLLKHADRAEGRGT